MIKPWRKLLFAVATFVVVLEIVLQLAAAAAAMFGPRPPSAPAGAADVVCVGDSFTYGIGATAPEHAYPSVLQALLRGRGAPATVRNGGRPGKDSAVVLRHLDAELTAGMRILCVCVGTNDAWSRPALVANDAPVASAPGQFEWCWRTGRLLALATRFAGGTWQQTGSVVNGPAPSEPPHEAATHAVAEPDAGFMLLERAGVIPATPREFTFPPSCPEPPATEVDRALRLLAAGQNREAFRVASAAAEQHALCAHAWRAVAASGDACGETSAVTTALDRLQELANGGRDAAGAHGWIAALGETRRQAEQLAAARTRLEHDPKDVVAWKVRQHCAFVLGHWDESAHAAAEGLSLAGRLSGAESAHVARNHARMIFATEALAARLVVAALLLDGDVAETRAVVAALRGGVPREQFTSALAAAGPLSHGADRELARVLDEVFGGGDDAGWTGVLRQHLERMAALAQSRGVQMVIVGYPFHQEPVERVQRETAAALGVPFVAVHERFARELQTRSRDELFVRDGHCNDAGYAIVAALVAAAVEPLLPR